MMLTWLDLTVRAWLQVVGLLGMYKVAHVRAGWPWLIPVHVGLYLTHMVQEIYDVHRGTPWYKNDKKRV